MFDQPRRLPFWQRHPWITGAFAFIVCCTFIHASYVPFVVIALTVALAHLARRKRALAIYMAGLRARADYEHRLYLAGDPRGTYGRYPPIWQ